MTRATVPALALSLGLLSSGCGGVDCAKAENAMKSECAPAKTDYKAVQALLVSGSCTALAACHGAGTPVAPNRLKIDVTAGKEKANYDALTNATNMLIDKTTPANSRLVTYPFAAMHTGGKAAGWMSATDVSSAKIVKWIMEGTTF